MDSMEGAFEADAELDAETLAQEQGHPRRTQSNSHKKVDIDTSREQDETSPLLSRRHEEEDEQLPRRESWQEYDEFAALPWYKRPSIFWILVPFSLMACAFGGIITPKMNLILELVCREYISEQQMLDPNFAMLPVDFSNGSDNDQCRIPEVQSRTAQLTLWCTLIGGLLAAFSSPKLGALSDRFGRKKILIVTSFGTICGEIITICAATYPDTFPVNLFILGFAIDGLTGSFIVAMAIANSYATDCTPPARRSVAFGYFHGTLFTGIAVGPIVAGYIVKVTGKLVVIFWVLLGVHIFFITFVTFLAPESLSKKRQLAAREKHKDKILESGPEEGWLQKVRGANLLEPLKVLWPTGPGSSPALRRNLFFLAAVDTIMFGVAMGSVVLVIIYTNYMFGWKAFESGRFMTIVNSSRVFFLIIVLPLATRIARGKPLPPSKQKNVGSDWFDLAVIRLGVLFDTLGYLGYTLARSGEVLTLSGAVAAIGGIASPTLQSSMTKSVPSDQTGALLGASGLLHALARVVAPTTFNAIYAATVDKYPQAVFACLSATFGLAFLTSWFLKPHVYFDEDKAQADRDSDEPPTWDQQKGERLPIIGPVMDAFASVGVCLGLTRRDQS